MRLFNMRKVVDEREEMEMLRIEHGIYWLTFWALLVSIFAQLLFLNADFRQLAGEWCVFMLMAVSTVASELRGGHFDYTFRPGWRAYLLYSVVAALAVSLINLVRWSLAGYYTHPADMLLPLLILMVSAGGITYLCLALAGTYVKHRRKKLEEEYEEDEE